MLSRNQKTMIRFCYSDFKSFEQISKKIKISIDEVRNLYDNELIIYVSPVYDGKELAGIVANKDGKALIDAENEDNKKYRTPVIISIVSVGISIIALIISIFS